jgi:invasion protein IalB
MRGLLLAIGMGAVLTTAALAQDAGLGTPVITPPILSQPETDGQGLVVPPSPASPAPARGAGEAQANPAQPAAQPAEAPPRTLSTEAFEQWTLECYDPAFEEGPCQITHRVLSGGANQVVMVFALFASSATGSANVQIALPLGISVPSGIQLTLGNGYQSRIEIQRCTPQGCIVEGTGSDALLTAMKQEASGTIGVANEDGQQIQLPFSLSGFTAAYTAMIERQAASR